MTLTESELKAKLGRRVANAGSIKAYARQLGIKEHTVRASLDPDRPISDKILTAMGYRRQVVFVKLTRASHDAM